MNLKIHMRMGRMEKMENEKKNFIADHALLTEENFMLAMQVANSYREIINRQVGKLLKKLETELNDVLGSEWEVETDFDGNAFTKWYFCIFKKKWLYNEIAAYDIGFSTDSKKLDWFYFYAIRNDDIIKKPLDAVKEALDNYKKGGKGGSSDWWQHVDSDYRNWAHDETLVKLYRQEEMVKHFVEQFIKMKHIIEPIVDEEIKQYQK